MAGPFVVHLPKASIPLLPWVYQISYFQRRINVVELFHVQDSSWNLQVTESQNSWHIEPTLIDSHPSRSHLTLAEVAHQHDPTPSLSGPSISGYRNKHYMVAKGWRSGRNSVREGRVRSQSIVLTWYWLMLYLVLRTASQTKNLVIIIIGAGFASLLIYTITSEMYSSNSPTNLFKDACERIKRNPRARRHYPCDSQFNIANNLLLRRFSNT